MFAKALAFLPPWVPFAVVGALLVAIVLGFLELKSSWKAEATAKVVAAVNGASLAAYSDQEARNQVIDTKLDRLETIRGGTIKETIREVYIQPSSTDCIKSPAMRALDGKLQYRPGGGGGGPAPVLQAPDAVRPAGRSP